MKLESKQLLLQPITIQDKKEVFAYRKDKEANKYQGWVPESLEDVATFIAKVSKEFNAPESWFQFVIKDKNSQEIIGDLGVHFMGSENQQVELGCTLGKNHQGKGFATEAMSVVIDCLFLSLNKHRITGSIDPKNTASRQLLERLGFRKEAHFKKSLFIDGKWVDDVIYALLKEDWKKKEKSND